MTFENKAIERLAWHDADIVYTSDRSGQFAVWRVPATGGTPTPVGAAVGPCLGVTGGRPSQVTYGGGWESWVAPDGKTLFYSKGRSIAGIWSVPVDGGPETLVPGLADVGRQRYWTTTEQGIWFAAMRPDGEADLKRFDPLTRATATVMTLPTLPQFPNASGLSVSPDGRSVHFLQNDQSQSRIMVIEGFR